MNFYANIGVLNNNNKKRKINTNDRTLGSKPSLRIWKKLYYDHSPGNLSHFRANLETNCHSFYFSTVLFYEVPRMTH